MVAEFSGGGVVCLWGEFYLFFVFGKYLDCFGIKFRFLSVYLFIYIG